MYMYGSNLFDLNQRKTATCTSMYVLINSAHASSCDKQTLPLPRKQYHYKFFSYVHDTLAIKSLRAYLGVAQPSQKFLGVGDSDERRQMLPRTTLGCFEKAPIRFEHVWTLERESWNLTFGVGVSRFRRFLILGAVRRSKVKLNPLVTKHCTLCLLELRHSRTYQPHCNLARNEELFTQHVLKCKYERHAK